MATDGPGPDLIEALQPKGFLGRFRRPSPPTAEKQDPQAKEEPKSLPAKMSEVVSPTSLPENLAKTKIPIPGTAPIPEGNIRLFHFTYPENLDSIRRQGLTSPSKDVHGNSTGIGYNYAKDSLWVYSDLNHEEPPGWTAGKPYVEFSVSPNEMGQHAGVGSEGTTRTLKPGMNVALENIVAIHEPWHEMVRHSKDGIIDPEWLKSYIDRSIQVAGMRGTNGNYTNYSEMTSQERYLKSQVAEAEKYLNSTPPTA